ncbi:radical SAM protein [Jannaschia rubra]|uniref:Coproporphyrinogen-III oxidase n=1 Tax=Jannaschia rubra TaxID=282197 RepID=A0A0M6XXH2_9RHOB|nr:radical SAM protein [Jannaschia rubra]CTQ34614.1 Oxygen-independent coproporphyrinogen-III oxidase [Jannaschia rubra]SFG71893.1 oxygen-independent coproporphyrinogen-3 oxidase [Jannaschia rubra]
MTQHAFLAAHGLFDARAPRYTSYPPAPHFTDAVGPQRMEDWLRATPAGTRLSVYAHVPFCRRLCWFCASRTQGLKTDTPLAPYVAALLSEARMVADLLPQGTRAGQVTLGGGTPTILPPDLLRELLTGLRDGFAAAEEAIVSVEVDPTMLDDGRLDAMAEAGLTRATLGLQDFDPTVQAAIGRVQTEAETRTAVEGLRARGVRRIKMDLLYGLPHQSRDSMTRTVDAALSMGPDRIALYGYAHVPWASRRQLMIDKAALPDGPTRLRLFDLAAARIVDAGYIRVGVDHFARPDDPLVDAAARGALRRTFQGYTEDAAPVLIGLGASAVSRLPQGHAQNAARTADWAARIAAGRLATVRGHAMTADDDLRGDLIQQLLCHFAAHPRDFGDRAGAARDLLTRLAARWPAAVETDAEGGVTLRPEAWPLVRLVAMDLDAYAKPVRRACIVA